MRDTGDKFAISTLHAGMRNLELSMIKDWTSKEHLREKEVEVNSLASAMGLCPRYSLSVTTSEQTQCMLSPVTSAHNEKLLPCTRM